jgi:hypothetical protein
MKKKKKTFDAGDDDRPTIIADYHRKEALKSPLRLFSVDILHDK